MSAVAMVLLSYGFVTKIRCEGRLLVSAVGNEALVQLEALPKEIGCGVILKPMQKAGRTNLILETSTGTVKAFLELTERRGPVEVLVKGDAP